jgi:hypothetical protein
MRLGAGLKDLGGLLDAPLRVWGDDRGVNAVRR